MDVSYSFEKGWNQVPIGQSGITNLVGTQC